MFGANLPCVGEASGEKVGKVVADGDHEGDSGDVMVGVLGVTTCAKGN